MKENQYKKNHYVPRWYQEKFIPTNQKNRELFYLDLKPDTFTDGLGVVHKKNVLLKQGPRCCFFEHDLYTTNISGIDNTEIEQYFFGKIDIEGRKAVNYFTNFEHPSVNGDAYRYMILYMTTQKMRTPKGLGWLSETFNIKNKNLLLNIMIETRRLYGAIWTECIWQIANASQSETKFIISDHPVTVYNRICGPKSYRCKGFSDPDIRLHATHTFFPLSMEKILILTNLSWVRNPYQSEVNYRPNPNFFRSTIFKFTDIQIKRQLNEQEVREINYITKKRAHRYIASANEEWLYPEKHVSTQWNSYGNGYLLMPDPRSTTMGGTIMIGHNDGNVSSYDEYGNKPWNEGFEDEQRFSIESRTSRRFKGEFARLFWPYRRGRAFSVNDLENEKDDDDFHNWHLRQEKKMKGRVKE